MVLKNVKSIWESEYTEISIKTGRKSLNVTDTLMKVATLDCVI